MMIGETQTTQGLTEEIVRVFRPFIDGAFENVRSSALHHFQQLGLPGNKHEEYRFTPLTKAIEKFVTSAKLDSSPASVIKSADPYLIPGCELNCIVFVNGKHDPALSRIVSPTDQLQVLTVDLAVHEQPAWVIDHFSKLVDFTTDGFAAFNTAFWRDAIFIRVPRGTKVEKPVMVLHLHDSATDPIVSASRLVLVIEENGEVQLIEKFHSLGAHPVFSSWVEEIVVGKNATFHYCKIQDDPGAFHQAAATAIHQDHSSHVNTFTLTTDGKVVRNNFKIAIDGERCESHFHGLYLLNNDMLADNHTVVDHRKPNSFSNELYKGVMDGNSKGIFNGKIYVRPQAQKTNAFQSNRNVLLTDTAVVHTKPQLEIWADDVKCSHGCTTGQLDEEALFYLQSRGISRITAQAMLLDAFASETLDDVKDTRLRSYLDGIITRRLNQKIYP